MVCIKRCEWLCACVSLVVMVCTYACICDYFLIIITSKKNINYNDINTADDVNFKDKN